MNEGATAAAAAARRGALERWGPPVAAGVLFAFLVFFLILRPHPGYPRSMDYTSWLGAAQMVLDGHPDWLYDLEAQKLYQGRLTGAFRTPGGALVYNRAPFFALLLVPLARLPFEAGYVLWLALMLAAGGLALWLIVTRIYPASGAARSRTLATWLQALIVAFAFFPVFQGTLLGQTSLLELLIVVAFYLLYRRDREAAAGAVLGLASYKPHLVLFIALVLVLQRAWRSLAAMALVSAALVLLSLPFGGVAGLLAYADVTARVASWNCIYGVYPELHQSWRGLLVGLLVPRCAGPNPEITTAPALAQADLIANVLSALTIVLTAAVWWRVRHIPRTGAVFDLAFAQTALASLLAAPYVNPQDLTRLVLVAALLLRARRAAPELLPGWLHLPAVIAIGIVLGPLATTGAARALHPLVLYMAGLWAVLTAVLLAPRAVAAWQPTAAR